MTEPRAPKKEQSLKILYDRGVPVATILDVGVCHGTPELIAAFPKAKHELFEPVEEFKPVIGRVYANVNYSLHLVAVGDENGEVSLRVRRVLDGMDVSHSDMVEKRPGSDPNIRTVTKTRLDTYVQEHDIPGPYFLKIDIDGHEMQVLRGAENILNFCSVVVVECATTSLPDRIGFLQKAGFRLFDLCEPCYYDECFWQCDAIFIHNRVYEQYFKKLQDGFKQSLYKKFT